MFPLVSSTSSPLPTASSPFLPRRTGLRCEATSEVEASRRSSEGEREHRAVQNSIRANRSASHAARCRTILAPLDSGSKAEERLVSSDWLPTTSLS